MKDEMIAKIPMRPIKDIELEHIKERICDGYCKFPEEYSAMYNDVDEAQENLEREKCDMCPLMIL